MRNLFKYLLIGFLTVAVSSCGMMTGDKFIYLGHGDDTPDYQLYYDKNKKLFVLIDKRNGCFQKEDTGTCIAFTLNAVRHVWVTFETVTRHIAPKEQNRHENDSHNVAYSIRKSNKRNTLCSLI